MWYVKKFFFFVYCNIDSCFALKKGSCWTFSTMSSIEAAYAKKTGVSIDLSEQQLVDCGKAADGPGNDDGCEGGWMPSAFNYLAKAGVVAEEFVYPYAGVFGKCAIGTKPISSKLRVESCVKIENDETAIKNAVMEYGSLAVAVDADKWYMYGEGIFEADEVGDINHAVNLIGWGPDYWLIRNSWGPTWGEKGCIRVAKTRLGSYETEFTFAVKLA